MQRAGQRPTELAGAATGRAEPLITEPIAAELEPSAAVVENSYGPEVTDIQLPLRTRATGTVIALARARGFVRSVFYLFVGVVSAS